MKNLKNIPTVKEDEEKRFNFMAKAGILYRFRVEAAKRGMSAGKLIGLLIESYINSLDQ